MRVLFAMVAAVVTVQVMVPLIALVMPDKPHRLGWQMYSGEGAYDIEVVSGDGVLLPVPWGEILVRGRRHELDWTQYLPEHLCTVLDEPRLTVTVGPESRTVVC